MITSHLPRRFVISKLCRRRIKSAHYVVVRPSGRMLRFGTCGNELYVTWFGKGGYGNGRFDYKTCLSQINPLIYVKYLDVSFELTSSKHTMKTSFVSCLQLSEVSGTLFCYTIEHHFHSWMKLNLHFINFIESTSCASNRGKS